MNYFILLMTFFSLSVMGSPDSIHVIFLSRPNTSSLFLNQSDKWVDAGSYECIPTGDGCFHPQLGIIEDPSPKVKEKAKPIEVKTINGDAHDLINCEKGNHFDFFCGKAKKKTISKIKTEIWIDTSSSMRQTDFSTEKSYCERRRLAAKVLGSCKDQVLVSTFNTAKQSIGNLENTCDHHGTNNGERLVDWIEASSVKNLYLITDVDEYNGAFREYLDRVNAQITGIGLKKILSTDLFSFSNEISKSCF